MIFYYYKRKRQLLMKNYNASIIIPVYNNYIILEHFINHLIKSIQLSEYQIIFIIDGFVNENITKLLTRLSNRFTSVSFYFLEESHGYSYANNIGRKYAKTDLLFFMNTDIFLNKHCLERMIKALHSNHVQAVQPLLIYPQTNTVQSTGHIFGDGFNCHALKGQMLNNKLVKTSMVRQALSLALCLIPAKIFDDIGGFDEYYYNGFEGLDLTLKITQKGYRCWYEASAQAYHIQGGSRKALHLNESQQAAHFWAKWGKEIKTDIIELLSMQLPQKNAELSYSIFDLTNNRSWPDILSNLPVQHENVIHKTLFANENNIDLFQALSYQAYTYPGPLIFLTTSFEVLRENIFWIKSRNNTEDLYFDLAGNVGSLIELVCGI